jgi:hypothetical protein
MGAVSADDEIAAADAYERVYLRVQGLEATIRVHEHTIRSVSAQRNSATTDGIATGLSRALVALEARINRRVGADGRPCNCERCDETMACVALVRSLLEAMQAKASTR